MFREYRKLRNLTQEKLAELTNIDIRTIQKIECEKHLPNLISFSKLIKVLDISEKDIINYLNNISKRDNKKHSTQ